MAFIDITTNNLSRELTNATTYIDNWAYVPGTSITGDYSKILPFTSLEDFKNTCGTRGPEDSITYLYICGLLSAGIPVLFRRIACTNQDAAGQVEGVVRASYTMSHQDAESEKTVQDLRIQEKWGGTYGNDLNISIKKTSTAYWLEVYLKYTRIERVKIITVKAGTSSLELNNQVIKALQEINDKLERITIQVLNDDPNSFDLKEISNQYLTGGTDFNENLVKPEIARTYKFIEDKILYNPKFITSGGYTDDDMTSDASICNAMIALSLKRQDCRALIDLPLSTAAEEQQTLADIVSYQQLANTDPIPSASICAPWQYMQVGTTQAWMPPSYAYLTVVGDSLSKGGEVYTPKAGLSTGVISNIIRPEFEIGSDLSEKWQSDTAVNINPIMKMPNGRYVIAGNSTLLKPDSLEGEINAFQESSADLTIIEIRRFVYNLGTELQYQYNSTEAFEDFALNTSNFLDKMISEGAVSNYNIYNVSTNSEPRTLKIRLDVYLTPTIKKIEIYLNVSYGNIEMTSGGEE